MEEATGFPTGRLLGTLTELELLGLAEFCPGKRYRKGKALSPRKPETDKKTTGSELTMSGEQAAVLAELGPKALSVAQLEEKTGLPAGKILSALTELELLGLAESCPGKRYRRG